MVTERTRSPAPDLFSSASAGDPSSPQTNPPSSSNAIAPTIETIVAPRHVLPKDLPAALKHLSDEQLDLMHTATLDELKRRGRSVHGVETDLQTLRDRFETRPNFTKVPSRRTKKRQNVDIAEVVLTRGQINAVRAAFKAGITTSRIARQFGLSQSDVRKALASDERTR